MNNLWWNNVILCRRESTNSFKIEKKLNKGKHIWTRKSRAKKAREFWKNFRVMKSFQQKRRVKTLKEIRVTKKSRSRRWWRDRDRRWWRCRRMRNSTLTLHNRASRSRRNGWSGSGGGRWKLKTCEGASFDGANLRPVELPRRRRRKRRFNDWRTGGRRRRVILPKDNASGLLL